MLLHCFFFTVTPGTLLSVQEFFYRSTYFGERLFCVTYVIMFAVALYDMEDIER